MKDRAAAITLGLILFGLFVLGSHPASANLFKAPWDKLAHFSVFAVLAVAIQSNWPRLTMPMVVAVAFLVGIADEFHQIFVPQRQPGWDDALADLIGSIIGLAGWRLIPCSRY